MAGPSVMVRILGDMTGLGSSFQSAGAKGTSAAASMHSAFSGMLGTLNQTGVLGPFGSALQTADQAMQQVGNHAKDAGSIMMGVGGAAAGLGLALSAMGSKDAAAHAQLQAAIGATGKSYDDYSAKIDAAIKHQEHFGNTAGQTSDALRVLTQATGDPKKALDLLGTATDLAAAKHEDLTAAAATLGKAYNGNGKVMKEFGITVSSTGTAQKELTTATNAHTKAVDAVATSSRALAELQAADNATGKPLTVLQTMKLQDAQAKVDNANKTLITSTANLNKAHHDVADGASTNQKALDELGKKLSGQASAQADTFKGKLSGLRAEIENHVSTLGQKYGPALTTAGAAMAGLGSVIKIAEGATEVFGAAQKIATGIQEGATVAVWLFNAAWEANPLGIIILAIALLVGAIVLIMVKTGLWKDAVNDLWAFLKVAWADIKRVISDVFNWIQANWPLLLGILFGPFGIAVALILTHWQDVVDFFKGLPDKIKTAVGDIGGILVNVGHDIIEGLLHGMQNAWQDVSGWMGNMGDKIKNFVKNPLSVFSPSLVMMEIGSNIMQGLGMGLASGFTQHVAPTLASTVGAILGPTTGAAQAAPATGAAAASSSSGPAVVVQHAHFGSEVDVDAFMRRAAWVAKTRSA